MQCQCVEFCIFPCYILGRENLLIHALNGCMVTENEYYRDEYHVTSCDLTDGRTNTGRAFFNTLA